jgi:hypothetical protein
MKDEQANCFTRVFIGRAAQGLICAFAKNVLMKGLDCNADSRN